MSEPIVIGDAIIKPGERQVYELPVARLYTHTPMTMPVHVIHGKKEGPRLFISAAIHGDEVNGVEIVRRLLSLKMMKKLRGTLFAIPIVNVYGFINRSRYLPDGRDLNRCFPGSLKGSLGSHLARLFIEQIVNQCTHGIDLHTGANHRSNLPQLRVVLDDPEVERLARAFGTPVIINARLRDNSLREAVIDKGIPMLLYEGGESLRFNEQITQVGLRGIIAVMRELGMLPKKKGPKKQLREPLIVRSTTWLRAPKSGILYTNTSLGQKIRKRSVIARIADPFGENVQEVVAPVTGLVIGQLKLPLVHMGDALFHVAPLEEIDNVEELSAPLQADDFQHPIDDQMV